MIRLVLRRTGLAVFVAVVMLMMICANVFAEEPSLIAPDSDPVIIDYEVDEYPWAYDQSRSDDANAAYVAGNSGKGIKSVSNLAVTVTGVGQLSFNYSISTPNIGYKYGLYYNIGAPMSEELYSSWINNSDYPPGFINAGKPVGWLSTAIPITSEDLDENQQTTVYIAYYRDGTSTGGNSENYVAISNVRFVEGEKSLIVNGIGEGGSVSVVSGETTVFPEDGAYSITAGNIVTLTAYPENGYRFYGWIDESTSEFLSPETVYMIDGFRDDTTIKAEFAPEGTYTARCNDVFYAGVDGLKSAIAASQSGDTVVMLENQTLSGTVIVPDGVTVIIPCMDTDKGYIGEGDERFGPDGQETAFKTGYNGTVYRTLTIPSGATLNINGTMLINAVVGYKHTTADQDISGGHGQIDLSGNIVVNNGGMLENYGLIDGSGLVTACSGGTIVDLYVVRHWRGGSHAFSMITADNDVYPMNEIDCHNITSEIKVESGGSFVGAVKMYASEAYHKTHFPQIDNNNGLIRLKEGASLTKTYDKVTGITTIDITGGAEFSKSTLNVVGMELSTSSVPPFPVDGDIEINMRSGDYVVSESFKLLTGAKAHLASDARLIVLETTTKNQPGKEPEEIPVSLVLYDKFQDLPNTNSTQYPEREAAVLTVDGGSTVTVNGVFAGRVATGSVTDDNPAKFITAANAVLRATTYEANGYQTATYSSSTTVPLNFKAELWAKGYLDTDVSESTGENTWTGDTSGWGGIQYLEGDLDKNRTVNVSDLNMLLANYNKTAPNLAGDIDSNGTVNVSDLNRLLANYNKTL